MTEPDLPGVEVSRAAVGFWSGWNGPSFLAVGARDPVLGVPAMEWLHRVVRGSPPPLVLPDAGHFAQESGDVIARAALDAFGHRAA